MRTNRFPFAMLPAAALALVAGCVSSSVEHAAHWSYSGETGPAAWGAMNPEWEMAHKGRAQSPINLSLDAVIGADLPALRFAPARTTVVARDIGHTIQWDCLSGGTLTLGGEVYALQQFHFHAPSEHTVEGRHYPVELHFVHKNAKGNLAVVSVMLANNPEGRAVYDALARTIPAPGGVSEPVRFDPYALLPDTRRYAMYQGSLTTPPCTEGVRWIVLTTPARVGAGQIASFTEAYSGNARPVQPSHGRLVLVRE